MAKYLDANGVVVLWNKIKEIFMSKEDGGELIAERELEILPVSAYGFDTNLRVNQQVDGSALVDKVIELTNEKKKQAVIKSGDYKYNVISIVNDEVLGIKGFGIETMSIDIDNLSLDSKPMIEKGIFLYVPTLGKTCTFYGLEDSAEGAEADLENVKSDITALQTAVAELESVDIEQLIQSKIVEWSSAITDDGSVNTFQEMINYIAEYNDNITSEHSTALTEDELNNLLS